MDTKWELFCLVWLEEEGGFVKINLRKRSSVEQ